MTKRRYQPIYGRKCADCGKALGATRRSNAKYCDAKCRLAAKEQRKLERVRLVTAAVVAAEDGDELGRTGPVYRSCIERGYFHDIHSDQKSMTDVAVLLGVSTAAVSRAFKAWLTEEASQRIADAWVMESRYVSMLPVEKIAALRLLAPTAAEVDGLITECLDEFWRFEHEFITIGSAQDLFIVKPFHRESVAAMFKAFLWGRRTLILTPPRHGKSEMVLRFITWIIIMFPNIQVLWVAANLDLAENMCTKLKGIFQKSEALQSAFLPPRKKFGDDNAPRWRGTSFTLYTRTDYTLTSPTFTALGSSATIAGRNADWIGIDDLEERKTIETADLRAKSRRKHAEIMERQEDHTGVCTIASRQHPDDIPHHLMEMEGSSAWHVLVFPAHDEDCEEDPDDWDVLLEILDTGGVLTKHLGCMLMPEIRSYDWLMQQRDGTAALGMPGHFPLRYLQKPVPVEGTIFDIPLIREKCLDKSRGVGMDELPPMTLVAGLDPAPRGTQAAFCWGWLNGTLYMIDLETQEGGGVDGAHEILAKWDDAYDLKTWFHEDNSGQIDAWKNDKAYQKMIRDRHLDVKEHTTGKNKQHPEFGISAMATWYHAGRISLPYGTAEARRKVKELLRQLELWTTDGVTKRGVKTDIKMAHWFPFPTIQKWDTERKGDIKLVLMSDQSYPTLDSNQPSWGSTPYPGG